jgi:hypothetical protein
MDTLASVIVALNSGANALAGLLTPVGSVPGWLSATVVAVLTGAAGILAFKYTSNQGAIKRTRRGIRANLLAVKLFKDNIRLGLRSQVRVMLGALRLLPLALVPLLVMIVPMSLLLAQLAAWYQFAPLPVGGETTVTLKLAGEPGEPLPAVELVPDSAFEDLSGHVRITSQREVCWALAARQPGYHRLKFLVAGQVIEKEFAVGRGVMRVSPLRPELRLSTGLLGYPREAPFGGESPVRSVEIEYPARDSWTHGTDNWMVYWFLVSLVAGFCLRGVLKVNI